MKQFNFQFPKIKNKRQTLLVFKQYHLQTGFTLIELILYISLVSVLLVTLVNFAWNVIEGGAKIEVESEVYSQARYVSEVIKRAIKAASSADCPNSSTLNLPSDIAAQNPTVFTYSSNQITLTSGTQIVTPVRIHSSDTQITAFNCTSFAGTNTNNVQITFTITSNNGSSRQEYQQSLSVELSGEPRN